MISARPVLLTTEIYRALPTLTTAAHAQPRDLAATQWLHVGGGMIATQRGWIKFAAVAHVSKPTQLSAHVVVIVTNDLISTMQHTQKYWHMS